MTAWWFTWSPTIVGGFTFGAAYHATMDPWVALLAGFAVMALGSVLLILYFRGAES